MGDLISLRRAGIVVLSLFGLFFVFHVCVITGIVPHHYVWGGRIESPDEMFGKELLSMAVLAVSALIVSVRAGFLFPGKLTVLIRIFVWILFGLFVLNTIGNLLARTSLETWAFTPITALLAVLLFRMGLSETNE
ncbi:MAG: hypothetical protein KDK33_03330 [Leptospiraceae bacterium]|nr:hypothetical protein [Leptospiraceae bacterium]